jgi:hypothetical protein
VCSTASRCAEFSPAVSFSSYDVVAASITEV